MAMSAGPAAAKIEAAGRRGQAALHLAEGPLQKLAIAGIIHLVVVAVIDRLLTRGIQVLYRIQPDQLAGPAAMVQLAGHRQLIGIGGAAERAG